MFLEEHLGQIPGFSYSDKELKQLLQGKETEFSMKVAASVKGTYEEMNNKWTFYDEGIIFSDINISYIVGKLNNIYISDPSKDVFGDSLELFRSQWAKQEGGQFFTHQRVTSLAI